MSGRRQHYLPRFLQRAFRFRGDGDGALVYAHERDRVYSPNVMGLGQQRDFYGNPNESGLDAAITATEARLAAIHRQILAQPNGEVANEDAATLISAISIRTKSMREAMNALAPILVDAMGAYLRNEEALREACRREGAKPKLFDDAMSEQLAKRPGLDRNRRAAITALARQQWDRLRVQKEDEIVRDMKDGAAELVVHLRGRAAEIADGAFLTALNKDPETPKRTERFAKFTYTIECAKDEDFYVLGDCGPVGIFSDGSSRLVLGDFDDGATLDALLLPLSPECCLVGKRIEFGLEASPSAVNRLSASLSHRFFVSNHGNEESLAALRPLIGSAAPITTEDEILRLMRGAGISEEGDED